MDFHAAIHPFLMGTQYPDTNSFFTYIGNRKALCQAIKAQLKRELGKDYLGKEKGDKCIAYSKISRNNFLGDLQEYAAGIDKENSEAIYMGMAQTRFNHLIEIRNNIGVYLPIFFFFPLRISIKQNALPIFVGSAIKLYKELEEIQKILKAHDNVDIGDIPNIFEASEEDVEDYEASHEGVDHFWPSFSLVVLERLVKKGLQHKLPIFIF